MGMGARGRPVRRYDVFKALPGSRNNIASGFSAVIVHVGRRRQSVSLCRCTVVLEARAGQAARRHHSTERARMRAHRSH